MSARRTVLKKKAWTRQGVSEIIGNLLILAITVTLFSTIMWFVSSMPGPAEKVYTDFTPKLQFDPTSGIAYANLTHKGGNTLEDYRTNIYLFVNNNPIPLHLSDGGIYSGQWSTGTTWSYKLTGVSLSTVISVMIVDPEANTVVYQASLLGGSQAAMSQPIIGDRGMDPSPTYAGNKVTFYASIFDPDGKLDRNSVTLNATSIGQGTIPLTDLDGDNVFTSVSKYDADISWNRAAVYVNAQDSDGKALTPARLVLIVLISPSGGGGSTPYDDYPGSWVNGTYPPNSSGGNSGGTLGTTFYYIKNAQGEITRDFSPGDRVTIELWSDTIRNMAYDNIVNLIFPLTGQAMSPQSSTSAFTSQEGFGNFYKYTYSFDAPSQSYTYTLEIKLKDNTGKSANIADTINVGGRDYPSITTYKLDVATGNLIKTTKFNHTDTMYVLINTRDVDKSAKTVLLSDLQIRDFTGTYIVQKSAAAYTDTPTYNKPMSSLFKTDGASKTPIIGSGGTYSLYLVLYDVYQSWWLPGTNTYTLKINSLADTGDEGSSIGEKYSSISCQFEVTAPRTTTDILASLGSGTFTWSASGATWANSKIVWYQGGDQWDYTLIDGNPASGPLALVLYDINGDGKDDVVVGSQSSTSANIVWYENEAIDGSSWSSARVISSAFDANTGNQASTKSHTESNGERWTGNGDKGNANEDATLWVDYERYTGPIKVADIDSFVTSYDGKTYVCQNELVGQISIGDLDGDGDGDIVASFIHVVIYTTAGSEEEASASNSWAMFFNRGIYVFWNDGKWTKTLLYGTGDWKNNNAANSENVANGDKNPAAGDIAVGDINQDGFPDVVAVYQDGTTKVWLNQWSVKTGDTAAREEGAFNSTAPMVLDSTTSQSVGGHTPWEHTTASQYQPLVEMADMDGNGYPDIIRTSTLDNNIYIFYTTPTSGTPDSKSPTLEFNIDSNKAATITGSKANLAAVDNMYEHLTETYVYYANQTLHATNDASINPGQVLSNTYNNDGKCYVVSAGETMTINGFAPPQIYASKLVSNATLHISWTASGSYAGQDILLEYHNGSTLANVLAKPTPSGTGVNTAEIDLWALGVDTWDELKYLRISFNNPSGSEGSVAFDHIGLDVQFVKTCELGWQWEIPNVARAFHDLIMVANVSGSESFRVQYSVDNETWFDAFMVSSKTETTHHKLLPYTPNSKYYIKVTDTNNGTDNVKDTLSINMLVINHYTQTVVFGTPAQVTGFTSSSPAITALTVGDITKNAANLNDIVFSTVKTTDNGALYIATQYSKKEFDIRAVVTTGLATKCIDGTYDTRAVQLGDLDGDGDLDIVLVVGFTYGKTGGNAPTLWVYYNNQLSDANQLWTFYEEPVSELGEDSAINIALGNIDLTIFLPLVGVVGIVAASATVERMSRRRKI